MPKIKHIRKKLFFASHPLYDLASAICNPSGESCGEEATYKGITFKLDTVIDTYYDECGKPQREVTVMNLNEPDKSWTVHKKNTEELANTPQHKVDLTNQPIISKTYEEGKLSWLNKSYYNERGETTLMEQAFYGDGVFDDFTDTPYYALISEFTYEYDQYGNWTLQYLYAKDKLRPDELVIREIEYQT